MDVAVDVHSRLARGVADLERADFQAPEIPAFDRFADGIEPGQIGKGAVDLLQNRAEPGMIVVAIPFHLHFAFGHHAQGRKGMGAGLPGGGVRSETWADKVPAMSARTRAKDRQPLRAVVGAWSSQFHRRLLEFDGLAHRAAQGGDDFHFNGPGRAE